MLRSRRPDEAELAALADGSLAPERRTALERQVAASPELANRLAEQQRFLTLAQSAAAEVEAPASLRARIGAQRRTRRAWAPRVAMVGGLATASVAFAVGLAVVRSGGSAERFHAPLGPTALNPGASGRAALSKTASGWRIELRAAGLPRLDGGRFYEAWLRNAAGTLVPVGTFNESRKVTLWAGVSPKDYTTLTVTRERADGDQGSSGEKVLVGTVDVGGSG